MILAAGAWASRIDGLPRPLPVGPLKGQMIALGGTLLRHAVMGSDVYLVPRGNETLVGATVEQAGFDTADDRTAIDALRAAAAALCPALAATEVTRAWAGIRPATPDMLPDPRTRPRRATPDLRLWALEERNPPRAGDRRRRRASLARRNRRRIADLGPSISGDLAPIKYRIEH